MQMLAVHLGKSPDLFSSRKLVRAMLRRNGLSVKKAEVSSIMRLNSATPELHAAFFDNLRAVGAHELPADMIISIDEAAVVSKEGGKTEFVSPPPSSLPPSLLCLIFYPALSPRCRRRVPSARGPRPCRLSTGRGTLPSACAAPFERSARAQRSRPHRPPWRNRLGKKKGSPRVSSVS